MEYDTMEQYFIWLASVEGMTPKRFYMLLSHFEDARAVWDHISEDMPYLPAKVVSALRAARTEENIYRLFDRLERDNISVISRVGAYYPGRLTSIYDPPPVLYCQGAPDIQRPRAIGIVGSRRASRDGTRAAREIARDLAEQNVSIVSGMARGVDTYAHLGSLEGRGHTVAVLGCGVDVVYPPENAKLKARILESGGAIISEYPPGTPPYAANFPARNRIISGLSQGVLLVEGRKNSGAMITVDCAMEQGRDVFAVPGSVFSPVSDAPNQLIFDGCPPVRNAWDVLEHYRWATRPDEKTVEKAICQLTDDERQIVEPLRIEELSFDELAQKTAFNSGKLNLLLTTLELRGIIKQAPGRMYRA